MARREERGPSQVKVRLEADGPGWQHAAHGQVAGPAHGVEGGHAGAAVAPAPTNTANLPRRESWDHSDRHTAWLVTTPFPCILDRGQL